MVFVGPSGCGKSTLLRLISGLEEITTGDMTFDGERVNNLIPSRRGIAMVFQSYAIYPHMNVCDNMAFGMKLDKTTPEEIKKRVTDAARLHHATSNVTMVYVTHDQVDAMTLADRIAVLRDGKLEQVGTPSELYENPNPIFVVGFIGSPKMNCLTGSFAAAQNCATLGVRSEHTDLGPSGLWSVKVLHAEDLGSDNYLFVDVGSAEPLIVRQPGKLRINVGDTVHLTPKPAQLHRFGSDGAPIR